MRHGHTRIADPLRHFDKGIAKETTFQANRSGFRVLVFVFRSLTVAAQPAISRTPPITPPPTARERSSTHEKSRVRLLN